MTSSDWANWAQSAASVFLLWKQNRIFQRQNEIFASQAGGSVTATAKAGRARSIRYWPMLIMAVLVLMNAGIQGWAYYQRSHPAIQEFDDPERTFSPVGAYGLASANSCFMDVNSKSLMARRDQYKIAIACFVYDGSVDLLDAPNVQVSGLYDINNNPRAVVTWGDSYNQYRMKMSAMGSNIALLNVPNGVQPSQFTTLRQARALGVKIVAIVSTGNTYTYH